MPPARRVSKCEVPCGSMPSDDERQSETTPATKVHLTPLEQAELLDLAHDCILVRGLDGVIVYWNRGATALYGYDSVEALGRISHDLLKTGFDSGLHDLMPQFLEHGFWEGELRHTCRNGDIKIVESRWVLQRDGQGVPARVLEINRDATERYRAAAALAETESQLRLVINNMPGLVSYIDANLRYRFANGMYADWFGMPLNQVVGSHVAEVLGEAAFALVRPRMMRALAGDSVVFEDFLPYGAVEGRHVHASYKPDRDACGAVIGFVVLVEDISARVMVERALIESESRFRLMADHAPVMVWVTEVDGSCSYLNKRWYEFTGQTVEEGLGFGWLTATHPDDRPQAESIFHDANTRRVPFRIEYRLRRRDGEWRWAIDAAEPRFSEDRKFLGFIGSVIDITDRKIAEDTLLRQSEELARSNADLQQFAYATSHDLQEPLRNVANFAQLLARRYTGTLGPEANEWLRYIEAGAQRMKSLIDALLAYSRVVNVETAPFSAVDTKAALEWALMNLQILVEEAGAFVSYPDDLPTVHGDHVLLVQIFQNLIANAIKYRKPDEAPFVSISAERVGDEWVFSVKDNGIGIATAHHERIFGVFKRLHGREVPGAGIGLAICRRIAQRHGGRIWVESDPNNGANFKFTIPHAAASE